MTLSVAVRGYGGAVINQHRGITMQCAVKQATDSYYDSMVDDSWAIDEVEMEYGDELRKGRDFIQAWLDAGKDEDLYESFQEQMQWIDLDELVPRPGQTAQDAYEEVFNRLVEKKL